MYVLNWLRPSILSIGLLLAVGCDAEIQNTEDRAYSVTLVPGTCSAETCGRQSRTGPCWCDSSCEIYNDCCENKQEVCNPREPEPDAGVPVPDAEPEPDAEPDSGMPSEPWELPTEILGVPDLDDDGTSIPEDNDMSILDLSEMIAVMDQSHTISLTLTGDVQDVEIWAGNQHLIGGQAPTTVTFHPDSDTDSEFLDRLYIRHRDYMVATVLEVAQMDGDTVVQSQPIELQAAPLVINHHLLSSERVWALSVNYSNWNNTQMINTYKEVLGDSFTPLKNTTYKNDVWVQDEFEFATLLAPIDSFAPQAFMDLGKRVDVVIDSIRNRGLDDFPENELIGPDFFGQTWGSSATTFDSFGNLDASPPVTVDGVVYPLGRIYYGYNGNEGLNGILRNFLDEQKVQAPFTLDTSWLCVGHVDEFSSIVPDPNSPLGFKFLMADIDAGLALLDSLPGEQTLPKYQNAHGYPTVQSMQNDQSLRAYNEDLRDDYLLAIRQTFKDELGLTDEDIILVPSLFERYRNCGAVALVPGMVNLFVADDSEGQTHLFLPDPFFRSNSADQASDPFIQALSDSIPESLTTHFVDDWSVYHLGLGEVHCGTNATRTPTDAWWNAKHLMQ